MKRFRLRSEDLEWREIEDEVVAVDLRSSTYLSTNGSGTLIWRALAGGATYDELIQRLTNEFGIDEERAQADLDRFLNELRDKDLIVE